MVQGGAGKLRGFLTPRIAMCEDSWGESIGVGVYTCEYVFVCVYLLKIHKINRLH